MVTGNADREGFKSRKDLIGDGRWFVDASRQQILVRYERVQGSTPGSKTASSLTPRLCGNQGGPAVGVPMGARPWTSVKSGEEGRAVGSRRHP
jgi:hypothetical protein